MFYIQIFQRFKDWPLFPSVITEVSHTEGMEHLLGCIHSNIQVNPHNQYNIGRKWVNITLRRFVHKHGNVATEWILKLGLCPTVIEWLRGFFIVYNRLNIEITAHSESLNSLEHCICKNIRAGRDSNPEPQLEQ